MREHPILFSGPMVRAILDDRKTQTRRIMRPQPDDDKTRWTGTHWEMYLGYPLGHDVPICPYGQPGDVLWVRESGWIDRAEDRFFVYSSAHNIAKQADTGGLIEVETPPTLAYLKRNYRSVPSIHMPRWASRLTLRITAVRVQRLQEITEEDADREGVPRNWCGNDFTGWNAHDHGYLGPGATDGYYLTARDAFSQWWDSINVKRAPWESNPWVWAISFERIRP